MINTGIGLAMTAVLAAVALTVRQPPPPAIAEFAPQAVAQIQDAPDEQASEFGTGAGSGSGGTSGATAGTSNTVPDTTPKEEDLDTTPEEDQVEVASAHHCIGNPPRQTEDPQSPPCVAFWEGDTGGETSPGVTGDTIRIGVPFATGAQISRADTEARARAMFAHFNQRYEFYGRKLVPVFFDLQGGAGQRDQRPSHRASADTAKQMNTFATTSVPFSPGYYERLIEHKIIGVYRTSDYTDSYLAANSPYLWGYKPSMSQILGGLADWACGRLVGGNATYAGTSRDEDLTTNKRKFGIIMTLQEQASIVGAGPLRDALEACGAEVPVMIDDFNVRRSNNLPETNNIVLQMRDAGVTSIFILMEASPHAENYQNAASVQRYFPEWLITTYPSALWNSSVRSHNEEQRAHTFGLMFQPVERVPEDHPSTWALREGGSDPSEDSIGMIGGQDTMYQDLLVLASGMQMAGPDLTPEAFRSGLHRTRFPNPQHPIMSGSVGFNEGDYSMLNDAAEVWFDNEVAGPYPDTADGALCWMNGGARRPRGAWEQGGAPFFQRTGCDYGTEPVS